MSEVGTAEDGNGRWTKGCWKGDWLIAMDFPGMKEDTIIDCVVDGGVERKEIIFLRD